MKIEVNLTGIDGLEQAVRKLAAIMESNQLVPTKPAPEKSKKTQKKKEDKPAEQKPITLEEVRAVLAKLSQAGKQAEVKNLITKYDAKKLSDIPANQYSALLQEAESL